MRKPDYGTSPATSEILYSEEELRVCEFIVLRVFGGERRRASWVAGSVFSSSLPASPGGRLGGPRLETLVVGSAEAFLPPWSSLPRLVFALGA